MVVKMPTFSEAERTHIQTLLIEAARKLFVSQGLKKTSLEELTSSAGIAKSSFYSFFESKEELYLELLMLERLQAEAQLLPLLEIAGNPTQGIAEFLRVALEYIDSTPITRRLITHPEEMQMVVRRLTPEHLAAKFQYGVLPIIQAVSRWQAAGLVIDAPAEVISGVMRAVMLFILHKTDIGEAIYPQVIDLTIQLIAKGLTRKDTSNGSVVE